MRLVEDEKKVSELVARALRAERYAVDVASDGQQGLQLSDAYEYDLIILDLMLPGLNGGELLRRIRRKTQQVLILILTARDAWLNPNDARLAAGAPRGQLADARYKVRRNTRPVRT